MRGVWSIRPPASYRRESSSWSSADAVDLGMLTKRGDDGRDPVGRHLHIVVGKGDDGAVRVRDPGVAGVREPLAPLVNQADARIVDPRNTVRRAVAAVVVDDEDFV